MCLEATIRRMNQPDVEAFFADARLVAGNQQNSPAPWVERKGHSPLPPAALKRNSFIFAKREPFSVSTRGRDSSGPNC